MINQSAPNRTSISHLVHNIMLWYMLLFCKSTKNSANNLSALCWLVLLKLKGIVHPKNKNSLIIFTLVLFQTCTSLFLLLNGKEDILKNVVTRQWFSPLL